MYLFNMYCIYIPVIPQMEIQCRRQGFFFCIGTSIRNFKVLLVSFVNNKRGKMIYFLLKWKKVSSMIKFGIVRPAFLNGFSFTMSSIHKKKTPHFSFCFQWLKCAEWQAHFSDNSVNFHCRFSRLSITNQ